MDNVVKLEKKITTTKEETKVLREKELTPKKIVGELDRYIIGQKNAKRSVAVALRNRWRRQQIPADLREEIAPKNIIMIGATGVGKTEIARRLAKLSTSPFIKVEASKFTEVGYMGRDVESIIRDLVELSKSMVMTELTDRYQEKAKINAEEKILDLLLPIPKIKDSDEKKQAEELGHQLRTREKFRKLLHEGKLDDRSVEVEVNEQNIPMVEVISHAGMEDMDVNIRDILGNMLPQKKRNSKMKVKEAFEFLKRDEAHKLVDMEQVKKEAINRVEQSGIVFLDEIDKVAGRESKSGPDVSREGVQRDLLPIVEGCTVTTKHGPVKTDHVLFIAAGAFHVSKPSDLIPELQGRFPIRVNLDSLGKNDFMRILTEPKNALIKQYIELLKTENVAINFKKDAISEIAEIAVKVNERTENIGARRLHTVMEKILDDISFNVPDCKEKKFTIDSKYVQKKLKDTVKDEDLSRYIL